MYERFVERRAEDVIVINRRPTKAFSTRFIVASGDVIELLYIVSLGTGTFTNAESEK